MTTSMWSLSRRHQIQILNEYGEAIMSHYHNGNRDHMRDLEARYYDLEELYTIECDFRSEKQSQEWENDAQRRMG